MKSNRASSQIDTPAVCHRFLDEVGDTTFFRKGGRTAIGEEGVSMAFGMGIVRIDAPLVETRRAVCELQCLVEEDPLFNVIPSVRKRIDSGGFFFHASKDSPDVRSVFLHYLRELPCEVEVVIARKEVERFIRQHQRKEDVFYADLLSHLIKRRMKEGGKLVLNIAERGSSTREKVLGKALMAASGGEEVENFTTRVVFNVQTPRTEPLLNIADYLCWAVQRVFERGELRYYDYLRDKIRLVVDLYEVERYSDNLNYYDNLHNPLTSRNKLCPPIT